MLHSDGADASDDASCAIRALVPHTMNAAFAVIRLAQRLAACTFALLISNTIVLTIHLTSKVDVEYALAIINVLLPVLGMCIIVCGVRVTDALRELHMTVVDPVSSVSAGPAEARAARDVGTYLQVLDAKVSVACIAHFMVVSRRRGIGPLLLCAQVELAFQVFGIAVTWTNMGTAAVSVGTAASGGTPGSQARTAVGERSDPMHVQVVAVGSGISESAALGLNRRVRGLARMLQSIIACANYSRRESYVTEIHGRFLCAAPSNFLAISRICVSATTRHWTRTTKRYGCENHAHTGSARPRHRLVAGLIFITSIFGICICIFDKGANTCQKHGLNNAYKCIPPNIKPHGAALLVGPVCP